MPEIFRTAFSAGFVIDGFDEPAFPRTEETKGNRLRLPDVPEVPPALVVLMRAHAGQAGKEFATPGGPRIFREQVLTVNEIWAETSWSYERTPTSGKKGEVEGQPLLKATDNARSMSLLWALW